MKGFIAQCKAELLRSLRNKRVLFFSIGFPVVFYLIFTSTVGGNTEVGGAAWKSYYLMSMTAFGLLASSINSLGVKLAQERAQGWVRLLRITPLSQPAYFGSKLVSMSLLNAGIIAIMFLVGYLAKGVHLSAGAWIGCAVWLLFGSLAFLALGSLIGLARRVELTQTLATMCQLILAMLGGLWFPTEAMPEAMKTIAQAMPTYHFAHGTWAVVAGNTPAWSDAVVLAAYLLGFVILSSYISKKQDAV
ncbi:ABC transporter permease [Gordoniibacillus kamchatkensis]|uniref:ABC transporter permease n=1 Tax=Gordoniibacillus kamchatkensis TaxID=1590651 RepID=A0ABR5AI71_9BACL|nr:ABC transporter permease [Paenibacillus sp. VKM B-2647]KIL40726.1 ABC transporter permease [Paenibacillus sp. VKM B-2647]